MGLFVCFFPLGKFDLNHMLIPVVDRPCLALVRQCRKKKRQFKSARIRDTARVFAEKFLTDFDSLVAIEKMVGAVLALFS